MLPEFAKSVFFQFQAANIPLLLAGGWAVCHHGYSRLTLDVDWVCQRSKQTEALALMEQLGFEKCSDGMASRFKHRREIAYPFIDLIWVDDESFAKMAEHDDEEVNQDGVAVVSFRALLAMKLFALKDNAERHGKDLLDLRALLAYGKNQISDEEFRLMCERYASPASYESIKANS